MTPHYETLIAGPLLASWDPTNGQLRWIMRGDHEVVRGIYGAVRDQFWGTVEPSLSDVTIERGENSFRVTFQARTCADGIDFEWRGVIVGEADGTISYSFDGLSHSSFLRQRIGLCVLHPIRECHGQPCRITHPDGAVEVATYPADVSPHQPFRDIAAIAQDLPDGDVVSIEFAGDVFETEDQRNWTDASYKTYCTPLDRPRPVEIRPGDVVRQQVVVRLSGSGCNVGQIDRDAFAVQLGPAIVLPRLGFEHTHTALDARLVSELKALRPDHLRVTLDLDRRELHDELRDAADLARAVEASLHAVITLGSDPDAQLERLAVAVKVLNPPIAAWLIFHRDEVSTSSQWLELARRHLAAVSPGSLFGGGSDQNFAELNRDRRPRTGFDIATFPINPQVHAFDDDSIAETLEAQGDTVATARTFLGTVRIITGPIVLEPRFAADGQRNVSADPRLSLPFSAAWTLGSVAALASAGCDFATFFEVAGPRGLFDRPDGSGRSVAVRVFEDIAELSEAGWSRLDCSGQTSLTGLAYRTSRHQGMLLGNPGRAPIHVRLPFDVQRLRLLDAAAPRTHWQPSDGREIVMPPHGYVRLEGELS